MWTRHFAPAAPAFTRRLHSSFPGWSRSVEWETQVALSGIRVPQNDRHNALIILRHLLQGQFFSNFSFVQAALQPDF